MYWIGHSSKQFNWCKMCLSIIWLNGMVFPEKPFLLPARFFRVLFEMVTMPFPCNGLLLCCVNLPKCSSKKLLVVQPLISIFWGDGLALALNSFWWFTYIVSQVYCVTSSFLFEIAKQIIKQIKEKMWLGINIEWKSFLSKQKLKR